MRRITDNLMMVAAFLLMAFGVLMSLTGCAAQPKVHLMVYEEHRLGDGDDAATVLPANVQQACAWLKLDCVARPKQRPGGEVVLVLPPVIERYKGIHGRAVSRGCWRFIWSDDDWPTVAHEIGHALGLPHAEDPSNLMHAKVGGTVITSAQLHRSHTIARLFRACW